MIFGILGPNELSVIERCPYYRGVRKERLDCTSLDLNICIEKVDAKYWLARVFQCLFKFALVSASRWFTKSDSSVDGEPRRNWSGIQILEQALLPFPAPPPERPESLLVGYDYTD